MSGRTIPPRGVFQKGTITFSPAGMRLKLTFRSGEIVGGRRGGSAALPSVESLHSWVYVMFAVCRPCHSLPRELELDVEPLDVCSRK